MPRNIEFKARLGGPDALLQRALALATHGPEPLYQDDTFFHAQHGRLKLRVVNGRDAELIYYERPDAAGPRASHYERVPVPDPDALRHALAAAWGVRGRVIKQRTLLLIGRSRVHLDDVQGLGHFVELEVVLRPDETEAQGTAEAEALMQALGIGPGQLEPRAYIDLLERAPG